MPSTLRRLASGSALRVVDFFATAIIAFFMMPFMVRSLGDRMYGLWAVVGTFLGYYGLLDLGMSAAVIRHVAGAIGGKNDEECNRVFNTSLILYTGLGLAVLVVSGVLAGLSSVISRNPEDASVLWKIILILGIDAAVGFPIRTFGGVLRAQLRYDIMSIIDLLSTVLRSVLIVVVLTSGYKILALAWVTFLSTIPKKVLYVYFAKKNLPSLRLSRKYWRHGTAKVLFSYSSFAFIAQMADQLRFNMDAFVITAFLSLASVTHYNVAATLVHYFIGFVMAFMGILQPLFSRQHGAGEKEAIKKTFFLATKISVWVSSFVGFGLIAWGKPFIERWMGPDYLDSYPCLVFLVLGCLTALWQTPSVDFLYGTSKHRLYAVFLLVEGICNLSLSVVLVGRFGIVGVAFGTFLPMVLIKLTFQPLYVCRSISIRYTEYVAAVAKTLAAVGLSLIIPGVISFLYSVPDYRALLVIGLASAFFYFLAIGLCGLNGREKRSILQAVLPRLRLGNSRSRVTS